MAPLLAQGELMGILVVGQPVAGGVYGRQEVESLFDLASHLATAIRDVGLHHQLHHEKEFTERILAHMSSGVVTIGRDERVGTINRRAEEVLGLRAAEVVGQDLRVLPSPLGDMLFETLAHGRARPATEIQLPGRNLWLEVSTYPIRGDETAALGAVLVLDDRTAQKELAARKRQAEEFQLLARVVARIADEIKNPLVSISTFVELIEERFDDPDFRKRFSSVVRRDARRLVQVFEKLAGLVSEGELHCTTVDLHEVLDDVVTTVQLSDDALGKRAEEAHPVKVDAAQLRKALSYLIWFLTHNSPVEEARVSLAVSRHAERGEPEGVRILIASRTASVAPEKLTRLFDPVQMVQESLIDVGPAVSQRLIEAQGGRLTLTVFALKAAASVLKAHPRINASLDEAAGEIVLKKHYHLGVAVNTEEGLIVPVVRDVDNKSLKELAVELKGLVERAHARKLSREELQGATFTITNAGALGGWTFTPIIQFPQAAILGLGEARLEPVIVGGRERPRLAARLRMPAVLSIDHRLLDGADAVGFLRAFRQVLEDPDELLLALV